MRIRIIFCLMICTKVAKYTWILFMSRTVWLTYIRHVAASVKNLRPQSHFLWAVCGLPATSSNIMSTLHVEKTSSQSRKAPHIFFSSWTKPNESRGGPSVVSRHGGKLVLHLRLRKHTSSSTEAPRKGRLVHLVFYNMQRLLECCWNVASLSTRRFTIH